MLVISREDILRVFSMRDAIESDKRAFVMQARGQCDSPLRASFDIEKGGGQSLFMPAHVRGLDATGVKIVSVFTGNPAKGKPAVPATMILLDDECGEIQSIMDGTTLTQMRTGALSGAATELLARPDASVAALFGTGGQAAYQLLAMLTVRPFKEVRVFDVDEKRRAAFVAAQGPVAEGFGARLVAARSPTEAVEGADVITTVTTSADPVFSARSVRAGAHVNSIGSYTPKMREMESDLLVKARVVYADNKAAVLAEAGDFTQPIAAGIFGPERIDGELGELIDGKKPGRRGPQDITVFKSVGFAALDVVAAQTIYAKARAAGIGRDIDI